MVIFAAIYYCIGGWVVANLGKCNNDIGERKEKIHHEDGGEIFESNNNYPWSLIMDTKGSYKIIYLM